MKAMFLFAIVVAVFAAPSALAETELERLRALCAEQERQIRQLEEEIQQLRSLPPEDRLTVAPAPPVPAPAASASAAAASAAEVYTVKQGDTMAAIARRVGSTPATLARLNNIQNPALIRPGQKLKLPSSQAAAEPAAAPAAAVPAATSPQSAAGVHVIRQGETFFSIARQHGVSTESLVAANPQVKPAALRPGQEIRLPNRPAVPAPAASAPAVSPRPETQPVGFAAADPAPEPYSAGEARPVMIDREMTYGEFADHFGSSVARLNALNGLELASDDVLAKGSELYIPAQP